MPFPFEYHCLPFEQNPDAPKICVFHASASQVLEWATVERLADSPKAAQRSLNKYKATAIKRFLSTPTNCIPTAVTIAIRPGSDVLFDASGAGPWVSGPGKLVLKSPIPPAGAVPSVPAASGGATNASAATPAAIREVDKPAVVIDGQHRLFGIAETGTDKHVTVVALVSADDLEIAFQFLVINNKSSKVSPDHIRALAVAYDENELEKRLKSARLTRFPNLEYVALADTDPESPFFGLIDWLANRTGTKVIPPAAIEGAVAAIQQKELVVFSESDAICAFFFTVWSVIKEEWRDLWQEEVDARDRSLLGKVGIITFTQYFTDALVQLSDLGKMNLGSPDEVRQQVKDMLEYQERAFWQAEWASTSYDTKAGRAVVLEALQRINRNLRRKVSWREDIKMLDPGSV
jgi:DGQHR domain-containing protein